MCLGMNEHEIALFRQVELYIGLKGYTQNTKDSRCSADEVPTPPHTCGLNSAIYYKRSALHIRTK